MAIPTPLAHAPPPPLPSLPNLDPKLDGYLRSFALWTQRGLSNKLTFSTAAPGILLQAYDAAPGTTPAVFLIQVKSDGTLTAAPVAVGGGGL